MRTSERKRNQGKSGLCSLNLNNFKKTTRTDESALRWTTGPGQRVNHRPRFTVHRPPFITKLNLKPNVSRSPGGHRGLVCAGADRNRPELVDLPDEVVRRNVENAQTRRVTSATA